ncbi:hypothetical protein GCM10023238_16540 [Streptomyces heliomycini]
MRSERAEKVLREVYATPVRGGNAVRGDRLRDRGAGEDLGELLPGTKISFINAMAEVCEAADGDVAKLAEAIGYDDRIGAKFLRAGIGSAAGCLPKDIRRSWRAPASWARTRR